MGDNSRSARAVSGEPRSVMRTALLLAIVAVLALPLGGCITTDNASATPDNPYPANYKALIRAAKSDLFVDPDSVRDATISAPKLAAGPIPSNSNNAPSKWVTPWIVCVRANARNRMGGYGGKTMVAVLIYGGEIFSTRSGTIHITRGMTLEDAGAHWCQDHEVFEPFPELNGKST
jgi:hypothetical protein